MPVAHQPAPVHHDIAHIARVTGVNQLGVQPVWVAPEARRGVQTGKIHQDQVGALARLQRPGEIADMQRFGAQPGGHAQSGAGRQGGGVFRDILGQQGCQADLFEHIQVIIRGRAVGADAHIQSHLQHFVHLGETGGQFQVRGGVVRHTGMVMLQSAHLAIVEMDAMSRQHLGIE